MELQADPSAGCAAMRYAPAMCAPAHAAPRKPAPRRQQGAFAIMFAPLLVLILVVCGLALNTGVLYNRKVELSGIAKAAALAAAQELNGTAAGIAAARTNAREAAEKYIYQYKLAVAWNDAALAIGTTPARGGNWRPATDPGSATGFYFAKVDTAGLDAAVSSVRPVFLPKLANGDRMLTVNESAIAGRSGINVAPIAICAMSDEPASPRAYPGLGDTELIEHGFRRGVSYDLMQLNPRATTPARFTVNPVSAPGMNAADIGLDMLGPFVCTGTMWIPGLMGGAIHVSTLPPTAPLAALYTQLNSRFDDYNGGLCSVNSAPPDANIKAFQYNVAGGAPWMVPVPPGTRAATSTTERSRLETVADIPPPGSTLSGVGASSYGPLWSYAKAVKYASYQQAGVPEPAGGYTTFGSADWGKLYRAGLSAAGGYQTGRATPYNPIGVISPATLAWPEAERSEFATPSRRVLNVPLLACSTVPSGANVPATVQGIGKFFMTVPATQEALIAEFAGSLSDQQLTGPVELYP